MAMPERYQPTLNKNKMEVGNSYKSVAEIKEVFGSLISQFASHTRLHRNAVIDMVGKIRQLSGEFCSDWEDHVLVSGYMLGEGGHGTVTGVSEQYPRGLRHFLAQYNSYSPEGRWVVAYTQVVAKANRTLNSITVRGNKKKQPVNLSVSFVGNTIYMPDFLHESVVQALITGLYTSSITPHVVQIFATYVCGTLGNEVSYSIIEKADFTLHDVVRNYTDRELLREIFTIENLVTWTWQVGWTAMAWKKHFGVTHVDLHFGNLLLMDMANPGSDPAFGSMYIKDAKWLAYKLDEQTELYIPVTRYLLKLADYGFTEVQIPVNEGLTIRLENTHPIRIYGYDRLLQHPELFNALEVNFFMRNVAVYLYKFIDLYGYQEFQPVLNTYNQFALAVDPSFNYLSLLFYVYPEDIVLPNQMESPLSEPKDMAGQDAGFIRFRSWGQIGVFVPIDVPLRRMLDAVVTYGTVLGREYNVGKDKRVISLGENEVADGDSIITCDMNGIDRDYTEEMLEKLGEESNCMNDGDAVCAAKAEQEFALLDPNTFHFDSLTSTTVKLGSNILDWDELKSNITEVDMAMFGSREGWRRGRMYEMVFEPGTMGDIFKTVMSYQPYHRNTLYQVPDSVGWPMEQVNLHLIFPHTRKIGVSVGEEKSLVDEWYALGGNEWVVNGGYFIVNGNISNPLTPFLNRKDDSGKPIGFWYDGAKARNTLPIPLPYEKNFGVVVTLKDGSLDVVPYSDFLDMHMLEGVPMLYETEGGLLFVAMQRQIKTNAEGKPLLNKNGVPAKYRGYIGAFCTGPFLVEDGIAVFTRDMMLTEQMVLSDGDEFEDVPDGGGDVALRKLGLSREDEVELYPRSTLMGQKYRVSQSQQNYYKFLSEVGEGNFMYGMRSSNNLHINAALCRNSDGEWFWAFAEGRGFNCPGIDRAQFTYLLSHFGAELAIAIDGGFSANAAYSAGMSGDLKLLLPSPDAVRKLGSMFHAAV